MTMSQRRWKLEQERKKRERQRKARRRRNCAVIVFILAVAAVAAVILISSNGNNDSEKSKPEKTQQIQVEKDTDTVINPYTTSRSTEDIKMSFFADSAFAGNALAETVGMYGILPETDFYAGVNVDIENVYKTKPLGSTTSVSEQFKSKRFKKVFLSFGEKELGRLSSTEFKKAYEKLVNKIEEYQPNARIYLIGIPPVTEKTSNYNDYVNMKKIQEFNKRIMSIAVDEELFYVDSVDALGDNKDFLPNGVSVDGINLNKAAVVDLLYYMSKEAYIPDAEDLENMGESDDEEDDEEADGEDAEQTVKKPSETASPSTSPSPTVNVLKSSNSDKTNRRNSDDE